MSAAVEIRLVCPGPPTPRYEPHQGRDSAGGIVWYPDKVTVAGCKRWRTV